ncbi:MAG: transcriptional regulator [Candidatus Latescibacteria bacterium]|nr:transcriptional regulator [bacterium]MBD3425514.1 transcriptional regulator [Candidatus Latescibacterota bacterium]
MSSTRELAEAFCFINKPSVMSKFFSEIFTPAEIDDFVLRWRLMKMLRQGIPQREIASELGISLCKITRGSKILKTKNSVTERIMKDKIGDT